MTDAPHKSYARVGMWILVFAVAQVWLGCAKVGEENISRFEDSDSRDVIRLVRHDADGQDESRDAQQSPVQPAVYNEDTSAGQSGLAGRIAADTNEAVQKSETRTARTLVTGRIRSSFFLSRADNTDISNPAVARVLKMPRAVSAVGIR